jgi:hypothetical protein
MKNSEKILKVAADLRKARIEAIVAPLRKKAQAPAEQPAATPPPPAAPATPAAPVKVETPTFNALAGEAKAWGKDKLGQFKTWGSKNPIGGGAAGGAVLGGMAGLIYEALRGRKEGERKDYLRAMLTHALLGAGGGALLGRYKPTVVTDGIKSLPS